MRSIWVITKRELTSNFDSLIALVLIVVFLGLSGFFTWLFPGGNVFLSGQADLRVFFGIAYWSLFIFIPAITMRSLAEETRSGTIELLSTKAVSDWQIIVGKYLSNLLLLIIALACTIPYYITIAKLGDVDHGAIIGGYFGLILLSSMYISIGIFASSLTNNQIISLLVALIITFFFHLVFDLIASSGKGVIGSVLNYLSARSHFDSLSRGVVDSRDLIYFASLTLAGLVLSQTMLSKRNWHK